jgi:protein involved in polysaccharide export with SLBB domain
VPWRQLLDIHVRLQLKRAEKIMLCTAPFLPRAAFVLLCASPLFGQAQESKIATTPVTTPSDTPTAARVGAYVLQPGDEIEIRSATIPELNQVARITPDGRISLVLLDAVEAAGLSADELGRRVSEMYGRHYRNPRATAIVRNFTARTVYVGGDVAQPGMIPLTPGVELTATAAVFRVGGFRDTAAASRVVLLRNNSQGEPTKTVLNVEDILARGKADIALQASDVLFVPRKQIQVYVGGDVNDPGMVQLDGPMTPLAAIIRAKGFRNTAQTKNVVLMRDSGDGKARVSYLNLTDVAKAVNSEVELKPYDILFVPNKRIARLNTVIDQYIRQMIPVSTSVGFSYLLGGFVF